MPLDSATRQWLAAAPAFDPAVAPSALRAATDAGLIAGQRAADPAIAVRSFTVTTPDGYPLAVRVYAPPGGENAAPRPALVWAHGGGWCLGGLNAWDAPCRRLAAATGSVLFAVDYRLAPEHSFPTPLNDVYAALCAVHARAVELGIDARRIAVGGDSAGGNLAAAACLLARERCGPPIARQLLLYPALDAAQDSESYRRYGAGYGLTQAMMAWCWRHYLNDEQARRDPLASPAAAASLRGLPDALLLVCEYDPLRDEAQRYAARLAQDGVRVRSQLLRGTVHGALHMDAVTPAARQVVAQCAPLWQEGWP